MDNGSDAIDMEILQQLKKTASFSMDTDDEDFVFGRAIALTMKNLQLQQKSLAKINIQQLLHEVEFPSPSHFPTSQDYYDRYNYEQSLPPPPNQ